MPCAIHQWNKTSNQKAYTIDTTERDIQVDRHIYIDIQIYGQIQIYRYDTQMHRYTDAQMHRYIDKIQIHRCIYDTST